MLKTILLLVICVFTEITMAQDRAVNIKSAKASALFRKQIKSINLNSSHDLSQGEGIVVAVVDSGVNIHHRSLRQNIWVNPGEIPHNGIDDDENGFIDDVNGWNFIDENDDVADVGNHGTSSASIIGSPSIGIAPKAQIISLRVSLPIGSATREDIFRAFKYSISAGANIINLSFTAFSKLQKLSPEQHQVLRELEAKKILLVMSAGNAGRSCFDAKYERLPYNNIVVVSALDLDPLFPRIAPYSNYGECYDIAAPAGVRSERWEERFNWGLITAYGQNNKSFFLYNGTSAAAPVVSGALAMALSFYSEIDPITVKERMLDSGKFLPQLRGKVFGARMIDISEMFKND